MRQPPGPIPRVSVDFTCRQLGRLFVYWLAFTGCREIRTPWDLEIKFLPTPRRCCTVTVYGLEPDRLDAVLSAFVAEEELDAGQVARIVHEPRPELPPRRRRAREMHFGRSQ